MIMNGTVCVVRDGFISYIAEMIFTLDVNSPVDEFKRKWCVPITFMNERSIKKREETSSQWAGTAGQLIDSFVNKKMSGDFDNLTIDVPNANGTSGDYVGGAKWIINGKMVMARW